MITWEWHSFESLSNHQLYDIMQLRELVFTIEQQCTEPDFDGVDRVATHLIGYRNDSLHGYLRVFEKNNQVIIGRILVNPIAQRKGIGKQMTLMAIQYLQDHYPNLPIVISAQSRLVEFYQSLGFDPQGSPYNEGGIEHVKMKFS